MRCRAALAALLSAASLLAAAREAAAWKPLDPSVPRWGKLPVGYYINQSTIPSGIAAFAVDRIEAGFAAWASPGCTLWQTELLGDTSDRYNYRDGKNVFHWISSSWPAQLGDVRSVIGVTMPAWGFNGVIMDADMVFNNVGFCWNDSGNGGCVDTQSIATHEEGHFLGLDHSDDTRATMTPYYVAGSSQRTLEADDIEGVCTLYPSGETTVASTTAASTTAASTGAGESGCDSCSLGSAEGACRSRYNECFFSDDCQAFYSCISRCRDEACADRCIGEHADGARLYINYVDCVCNECATECSAECSGGDDGTGGAGGADGSSASSVSGAGGSSVSGAGGSSVGGAGGAGASGTSVSSSSAGGESTVSSTGGVTASSSTASSGSAGSDVWPPVDTPASGNDEESGGGSGCSCSTSGRSPDLGGFMLLGVLGALASRRRRS